MPRDLFVEFVSILQPLEENGLGEAQMCGELLFFPELNSFANEAKRLLKVQESIVPEILEEADPLVLSQRLPGAEIEESAIEVEVEAPERHDWWREPLVLRFFYLHWMHTDGTRVAYLPALGIEVLGAGSSRFEDQLRDHILFALSRSRVRESLFDLALLMRRGSPELRRVKWNVFPLTPAEREERSEADDQENQRILPGVGRRLEAGSVEEAYEREEAVQRLAQMLAGRRSTSVLLVGEPGCGKSAVVNQLCREAARLGLERRPIWKTSGSRIVAGMTGFGDWQERCRKMVGEAKEEGALLYFGNLFELLQVGQSACSSESVGTYFRGPLVRGEFLAIAECTPRQLALIEQLAPRMLDAFRQLTLEPSTPEETRTILTKRAARTAKSAPGFRAGAVDRVLALHQRYAGYSALPGKAVRFLERLMEDGSGRREPLASKDVDRIFAAETGLPEILIDEAAALDPAGVEAWFQERIIGQDDAVTLVVDTIAAIKARVTRPGKPLASFFFVGPTGVGKTELARTLAEFFYGSRDRLIRLDMSEFSAPGSAGRLASAGVGNDEGILTAQLRDQPFSVVLLDEFEKADASVYDLFLQVLGEARLTDGAGRLADFSNAIVILTSNLGAREFRVTRTGFHDPEEGVEVVAAEHFAAAVKAHFRPEFFNRIDRVAPFLPLDLEAVRAVVRRELSLCDGRDGLRNRNLSLIVQPPAIDRLAELGYDPRYGARPVKRAIERHLLRPLGEFLCGQHREAVNGFVNVTGFDQCGEPALEFVVGEDGDNRGQRQESESTRSLPELRRRFQRLGAGSYLSEFHSECCRLEKRIARRGARGARGDHERHAELRSFLERFESARAAILTAEEEMRVAHIRQEAPESCALALAEAPSEADFGSFLIEALALTLRLPDRLVLAIRGDGDESLIEVGSVYRVVAEQFECDCRVGYWRRHPSPELRNAANQSESRPEIVTGPNGRAGFFEKWPPDCAALALEISGSHAALRFVAERGLHLWVDEEGDKFMAFLDCFDQGENLETAWMSENKLREHDWSHHAVRRRWDAKERRVRDALLRAGSEEGKPLSWEFGPAALTELIERKTLMDAAEGMRP